MHFWLFLPTHASHSDSCLVMQPSESLYDQKPAEIPPEPVAAVPAVSGGVSQSAPRTSRFVYTDDAPPPSVSNSNSTSNTGHVAAPSTMGDFFAEFGPSSGARSSYSSGRAKIQVCYAVSLNGSFHLAVKSCNHLLVVVVVVTVIVEFVEERGDLTAAVLTQLCTSSFQGFVVSSYLPQAYGK